MVNPMRTINFVKGHGTLNDFVVIVDRHNTNPLTEDEVRLLCDRRAGVGADGVLRAVKAQHIPEWDGDPDLWFMDYRNADGSTAEMCGNGTRVFGRHLADNDLVSGREVDIATRAGLRRLTFHSDGSISTAMGTVGIDDSAVVVHLGDHSWPATRVDVGNPHAVVLLGDEEDLNGLDLTGAPSWTPTDAFPHGVNVEFVQRLDDRRLGMRVFERGSGETKSCGTGVVASVATYARHSGHGDGKYRVDVAGGVLGVELAGDQALLRGPAVIVASGKTSLAD
ncbi:diaminopimelate epimerase [Tessaracoccus sp. SD287]|uniref:diaminopimelate epimerase n=1 Tax=Tessaracoccus sp. SD287 TaxID=2782008 RepID=UPI001F625144|nr:diaminopimelate epimerase [Tessaracoccus sp. SD287]